MGTDGEMAMLNGFLVDICVCVCLAWVLFDCISRVALDITECNDVTPT